MTMNFSVLWKEGNFFNQLSSSHLLMVTSVSVSQ